MTYLPTSDKVKEFLSGETAKRIAASQNSQNHVILIILIIFVVISVITIAGIFVGYVNTNKEKLQKNWKNLRCKPQYMPFASVIGPKGTSFGKNFSDCMSSFYENSFNSYIAPYFQMFTSLTNIVAGLSNSVQKMREMMTAIRDNIEDYARSMSLRLKMAYLRVANIFRILQAFFSKAASAFIAIGNIFKYMYYIGASIWNGPAGWFFRFFLGALDGDCCFDGNTEIEMKDGSIKKIKNIKIGDKLKIGERVIGIYEFKPITPMYEYNGILVSGTHRVYSPQYDKFIKISEINGSKKINDYNCEKIYCLSTEMRRIGINNYIFMDYRDCINDNEEIKINQDIVKKLNGISINEWKTPLGFGGISGDALVKMNNCEWKKLNEIQIGDILYGNKKVYGTVNIETDCCKFNKYSNDIWMASSQLIYNGKSYYFFNRRGKIMCLNQIFCEGHEFIIKTGDKLGEKEIYVRDYEQCDIYD